MERKEDLKKAGKSVISMTFCNLIKRNGDYRNEGRFGESRCQETQKSKISQTNVVKMIGS